MDGRRLQVESHGNHSVGSSSTHACAARGGSRRSANDMHDMPVGLAVSVRVHRSIFAERAKHPQMIIQTLRYWAFKLRIMLLSDFTGKVQPVGPGTVLVPGENHGQFVNHERIIRGSKTVLNLIKLTIIEVFNKLKRNYKFASG